MFGKGMRGAGMMGAVQCQKSWQNPEKLLSLKTNSSPLKIGHPPKKSSNLQPWILRCYLSFREANLEFFCSSWVYQSWFVSSQKFMARILTNHYQTWFIHPVIPPNRNLLVSTTKYHISKNEKNMFNMNALFHAKYWARNVFSAKRWIHFAKIQLIPLKKKMKAVSAMYQRHSI